MKPFVVNRHGRIVFPANVLGALDFAVLETLDQFTAVVVRDLEAKAPTGADIVARVERGAYPDRFALLQDLAQHLYWLNRYTLPLFEPRPTRWRDLPLHRTDVFLPQLEPWQDGRRTVAAVGGAYRRLPPAWDAAAEDRIFALLLDVLAHQCHHTTELPPLPPTVAEMLARPDRLTLVLPAHDPDYRTFRLDELLDAHEGVPELEALLRWAMVLHNQHPWDGARAQLQPVSTVGDDDFVIALHPRDREVAAFLDRVRAGESSSAPVLWPVAPPPVPARPAARPCPPVRVREVFAVAPRLEALSAVRGEHVCSNVDVVRNASFSWSPLTAEEIGTRTGIGTRRYSSRPLGRLALDAARAALDHSGRAPEEVGAVLVATCTNDRLIPSLAARLSGELGIVQTHAALDLAAGSAGLAYGLAEAVRLLQQVRRPVLLVCAEKFSDRIGNGRTSRMLFGDGAAALVVAPVEPGTACDVHVLQTYAGGQENEVNAITWPDPDLGNDITVDRAGVASLVRRQLDLMIAELSAQPDPDDPDRPLLDGVELIVPHPMNRSTVLDLARAARLAQDRLYSNIASTGDVSAASIPLALHDAVRDGVIRRPTRVLTAGFGAGAVGGYVVLTVDPRIVAEPRDPPAVPARRPGVGSPAGRARSTRSRPSLHALCSPRGNEDRRRT